MLEYSMRQGSLKEDNTDALFSLVTRGNLISALIVGRLENMIDNKFYFLIFLELFLKI